MRRVGKDTNKHWNRISHDWKYELIVRVEGVDARLVDVG